MDAKLAKLSSTNPLNFRPGPALAEKLAALQDEVARRGGEITPTIIIRDGLLGCWAEVRAHLLVRHTTPATQHAHLSVLLALATKALESGVTPEELEADVSALIERKLTPA